MVESGSEIKINGSIGVQYALHECYFTGYPARIKMAELHSAVSL